MNNIRKKVVPALLVLFMGIGSFGTSFVSTVSAGASIEAAAVSFLVQADTLISADDAELIDSDALDFGDIEWTDGTVAEDSADEASADTLAARTDGPGGDVIDGGEAADDETGSQSLWAIFIAGFIGGFAAFLMPCIFPLLPLTVSFFTKSSQTRSKAVGQALIYGLSIIVIYVTLGLAITLSFGPDALNALSTNGIFNILFFLLLVVFGISFLGAFEITLPSSFVNRIDAKSDKGGLVGIFFMAATLAVVSFSCTGPIIGTLLVQAATMGELLGPAVGMFGFAIALAIPFCLFAMFPSWMKSLPSSGGWLNSVKVTLGFLELALALKFLSNVDLAYHWKWFDRELFLVLWIVIFAMLGFYLMGKIRFKHDSKVEYVSLPRLFLSILVFSFTVYMVPGLWGAPLKSISAFLPPQSTQDFDLYTLQFGGGLAHSSGSGSSSTFSGTKKYADILHAPLNLDVHFDYEEGRARAEAEGKPLLLDFTGHACVNCRQMEASVWPDKEVYRLLSQEFIIVQLYVDDKTALPEDEQFVSEFSGKRIRTIGNKWSDLQAARFNSNSQPYYVMMDPVTETVLVEPKGADYNADTYAAYLRTGLDAMK